MLALGGCATASTQMFPRHYILAGSPPKASRSQVGSEIGKTLEVARIVVPQWLAGTNMYYRLTYRDNGRVSAYARSDWIAPPAAMLAQMIRNTLTGAASWHAVVGPDSSAEADFSLHIRIENFSQVFTSRNQSDGQLDATATLVDHRHDRVLAQRRFQLTASAPSADAAGGAKALQQASRQFVTQLQHWLAAAMEHPASSSPRREPAGAGS